MVAEFISLQPDGSDTEPIDRAARALADGALAAFPTETVYGIAANAARADSVRRLLAIKGRDNQQPFTVHIGRRAAFEDFVPDPTAMGRRLIRKAWPGPLTLVFPLADPTRAAAYDGLSEIGAESIYKNHSVGLRCPDHPVASRLLIEAGCPIIASSANVAGEAPATEASPILERFGQELGVILDAGPTRYKQGSTVAALNGDGLRILRPGVLDERTVRRLATVTILFVCTGNTCRSPMAEGIFRQMAAERLGCDEADLAQRGVVMRSAGTLGVNGGRASREAIEVCRKRGIDLSDHVSQGLTVDLIQPADYIFTMGRHHVDVVRSIAPRDADRAVSLDPDEDISDPIGGTVEDYARTADRITRALRTRINEVAL